MSRSTIKRAVKERTLPVIHLRGRVLIDLSRIRGVSLADVAPQVAETLRRR